MTREEIIAAKRAEDERDSANLRELRDRLKNDKTLTAAQYASIEAASVKAMCALDRLRSNAYEEMY